MSPPFPLQHSNEVLMGPWLEKGLETAVRAGQNDLSSKNLWCPLKSVPVPSQMMQSTIFNLHEENSLYCGKKWVCQMFLVLGRWSYFMMVLLIELNYMTLITIYNRDHNATSWTCKWHIPSFTSLYLHADMIAVIKLIKFIPSKVTQRLQKKISSTQGTDKRPSSSDKMSHINSVFIHNLWE